MKIENEILNALDYANQVRAARGPGFIESDGDRMFVALADVVERSIELIDQSVDDVDPVAMYRLRETLEGRPS